MSPIKQTTSICPTCHQIISATIYEKNNKLYMSKTCPEHGYYEDLIWYDYELYKRFERFQIDGKPLNTRKSKKGCPYDCGICEHHKSSTVLGVVDVTSRCNLRCPDCFAYPGEEEPTQDEVKSAIDNLAKNSPCAMGIQLSGGEPTLRADLPEIISYAKRKFDHVEVDTNGIKLAESVEYCKTLESAGNSVIYLQFDGTTDEPYQILRRKNLWKIKRKAVENHRQAGQKPAIVLVPTVVKGVNDHQIGDIIRFAIENSDVIRGVNFQPISFCGRAGYNAKRRITVPDVIHRLAHQTKILKPKDFYPAAVLTPLLNEYAPASCHFSCGTATYLLVNNDGVEPITSYLDVENLMNHPTSKFTLLRCAKWKLLKDIMKYVLKGKYKSLSDLHFKLIFIGAMHFMDPYNLDFDRLRRCIIHYALPDGRIVPFCSYNIFGR